VKEFLSQRGVPYVEKMVDSDRAAAIEMIQRSGQRGVPVTVINDEVVVGFDRARLERILAQQPQGGTSPKKGGLGALVKDAGSLALYGGKQVRGAYVGGVNSGSPADRAGLRIGDVVVAVDGKPIAGVDDLAAAIKERTGDGVRLTLARGTTEREVRVQL
jgi:glutaredoxin 3